jgi:glycosyltransferase involved in cell wall biosynthesis
MTRVVLATTVPVTLWTFYQQHVAQLRSSGLDVLLVTSPGPLADRLEQAGQRVHRLPMTRSITPGADARALIAWLRLLRRERPAAVLAATPKAALLGMTAAWLARIPQRVYLVGGLRLEGERGSRRRLLMAMEQITGAASTHIVVNSASLSRRSVQLRLFRQRKTTTTVPGSTAGVDSTRFTVAPADEQLRASLGLTAQSPVVMFIGRITHDKGIDILLQAVELLDPGRRPQLLVVGPQDEPDSAPYVDKLRRLPHVVLTGSTSDPRPYFRLATLHVLPSLREGFPNVVLEASACGVPTVTTDATGCVDSVRDGVTGLIVPAGDAQALADAMKRLLEDPAEAARMGASAREWVSTEFQPARVVNSMIAPVIARVQQSSPTRSSRR